MRVFTTRTDIVRPEKRDAIRPCKYIARISAVMAQAFLGIIYRTSKDEHFKAKYMP
jgi:hypothetical protein